MRKLNARYLFLTVFFAVYMFLATASLSMVHVESGRLMDGAMQQRLYYWTQGAMCFGYIAFFLLRRFFASERGRIGIILAGMVFYTVSLVIACMTSDQRIYFIFGQLMIFFAGLLGAFVYYCMSASLVDSPHMGKVIGIGGALAIAVQYLAQIYFRVGQLLPALMIISFSMLTWLVIRHPFDWLILDYLPYESRKEEEERGFRHFVLETVMEVLMLILIPLFYDTWLMHLSVSNSFQSLNAYTWPRLFMAAGYLFIGLLADLCKGRFLHIGILSIAILGVLYLNPEEEWTIWLGMSLYYFQVAAIFGYGFTVFWRLAPRTRLPELFPSLGKLMEYALGLILGVLNVLSALSFFSMRLLYLCLCVLLLLAMAFGGKLALMPVKQKEERKDPFLVLRDHYELTPREEEVARQLVLTELKTQEIADALFVSRRVIQRYIASIYEKTGTKSRVGLYQLYSDILHRDGAALQEPAAQNNTDTPIFHNY